MNIKGGGVGGGGDAGSNGKVTMPCGPSSTTSEEEEKEVTPAEQSIIQKILRTRLVESAKQQLEVIRKDPTSPLYSAKTFEELNL
jgi:ATP-dependent RNA helicase DDX19/DBP5